MPSPWGCFSPPPGATRLDRWIAATDLPPLAVETSVEVLDRHGALLRAYTVADGRWRLAADPGQVDPLFVRMLVAYEDKRFYRHRGVDLVALARATGQALWNGRIVSGASTLTMQTARLLEDGPTGTLAGKLRQMRLALALERRLTKPEILALYLDRAPYGGNTEGIRAAARAWFGKEPRAAHPGRGGAAGGAAAIARDPPPRPPRPGRRRGPRPGARPRRGRRADLARHRRRGACASRCPPRGATCRSWPPHLADRLAAREPRRGRCILTTLDADLQARLEALAAQAVRDHGGGALSIAIIVADHTTGEVLASVGLGRLLDRDPAGVCRHDHRAALAGLDAEAARLCARLRRRAGPPRNDDRRPADAVRRLRAGELRR